MLQRKSVYFEWSLFFLSQYVALNNFTQRDTALTRGLSVHNHMPSLNPKIKTTAPLSRIFRAALSI